MADKYSVRILSEKLAVCRFSADAGMPAWAMTGDFWSLTRTPSELSVVCPQILLPDGAHAELGWRAFEVVGALSFDMTGVLSALVSPLAEAGVGIFTISTYDSDYILVKEEALEVACRELIRAGHTVAYP